VKTARGDRYLRNLLSQESEVGRMGKTGIAGTLSACIAVALSLCAPAPAWASQAIESFAVSPSDTQAGGHPDLQVSFSLAAGSSEAAQSVVVNGPTGMALLPRSVPACSDVDFGAKECPPSSQVGLVTVHGAHEGNADFLLGTAAVYSRTPAAGEFGRLGFFVPMAGDAVGGPIALRSGTDYGARLTLDGFPEGAALRAADLTLWGAPSASLHDADRLPKGTTGCPGLTTAGCATPTPVGVQQSVLVENPPRCVKAGSVGLTVTTHQDPGHPATALGSYARSTNCNLMSFNPGSVMSVGSKRVRNPAALDLDLTVPQTMGPATVSPSHLRSVITGFFGGLTLDEAELEGRPECSAAQAGFGSEAAPACPPGSQLGMAEVGSPMFPAPIPGGVFYGGFDPEGGYRLYVTASGYGVDLKLPMLLGIAEEEGEEFLVTGFLELPQIPIEQIVAHLFESGSSPLITGPECGDYEVETLFSPWNAVLSDQLSRSTQTLDAGMNGGPCPTPASVLQVSLQPSAVLADGHSVTTATATVREENGDPVFEDQIVFSSSDPAQHVGPVVNHEDGTYSARIVSSTTPGNSTITATDASVSPGLSGSATLHQDAVPAPPRATPVTTIVRHPRRRSRQRRATFAFSADIAGSSLSCKLDAHAYRPCTSPRTFSSLKPGPHTFSVFATGPTGAAGAPATYRFVVRRPRPKPPSH
jgi:hypothetical protein